MLFYATFRLYNLLGITKIVTPLSVPADLQSAVKKCSTYKNRGICNPPTTIKGKAYSFAAELSRWHLDNLFVHCWFHNVIGRFRYIIVKLCNFCHLLI